MAADRTLQNKRMGKAGWNSRERSTPEGYNREDHACRFGFTFPPNDDGGDSSSSMESDSESALARALKNRRCRSAEERNALREKRDAQRRIASEHHAQLALRKYNTANDTKYELVEVTARVLFFEFGGGCLHYNFTAKPVVDQSSADGKLFFAEVNYCPQSERDVLLCCIVGDKDAGHCFGCEGEQPIVVHPASRAYGGGHTNVIDMPGSDVSSCSGSESD